MTIASPREALAINAAASLAVMVRPVDGAAELGEFLARQAAQCRGAGARAVASAQAMREQVLAALASQAAVVLDADALTSFATSQQDLVDGTLASGRACDVVLTPHEGEFSRIFNNIIEEH